MIRSSYIAKSLRYFGNQYLKRAVRVVLPGLLFMCVFSVHAQYFNLRIDFMGYEQGENGFALEQLDDGNYLVFLGGYNELGNKVIMGRTVVSSEGGVLDNFININEVSHLFTGYSNTSFKLADGGFVSSGSRSWSSGIESLITLCRYNESGELDWIKFYGDSINQTLGRVAVEQINKNLAAVGGKSTGNPDDTQGFLLITDSIGNELIFREFGGGDSEHLYSIYPTNDSGYILGGYTKSFGTVGKWDQYIVKTDSVGNQEWMEVLGSEFDDCPAKVIQTADSNYVFCGCWTHYNLVDNYSKLYMAKLDQSGDVMWEKEYLDEPYRFANLRKVIELPDGGFIAAGLREGPHDGLLLRTDSEGNEIWLRSIKHPTIEYNDIGVQFVYDVIADDAGGFVGTGWMYSPPNDSIPGQDLWVFRTDSMGCLVPGCHLVDNVEVHEEEVLVQMYPNPVDDLLSVHVRAGAMPRGAQLQVYDLQGREQYATALNPGSATYIVPMGHLPAGMYVLRCVTEGEVVWSEKILKE